MFKESVPCPRVSMQIGSKEHQTAPSVPKHLFEPARLPQLHQAAHRPFTVTRGSVDQDAVHALKIGIITVDSFPERRTAVSRIERKTSDQERRQCVKQEESRRKYSGRNVPFRCEGTAIPVGIC